MSSSREAIYSRIRSALGREPGDFVPPVPSPEARSMTLASAEPLQRFAERLAVTGVTLERLELARVPQAVAHYRGLHAPAATIAVAPALETLDWLAQDLPCDFGTTSGQHGIAVSQAWAGIAATGSLVLVSDESHPASLNFLPEHHLVVLSQARLLDHLDQLWPLLQREGANTSQAIHLVTGPSSTADIGGHLLYGAHGPRAVHVLLVD